MTPIQQLAVIKALDALVTDVKVLKNGDVRVYRKTWSLFPEGDAYQVRTIAPDGLTTFEIKGKRP